MRVFERLKNALFEEEYVEVEEKPKAKPIKKEKVKPREVIKENKREEKPIAKKVILPEKKEIPVDDLQEEELIDDDFEIKPSNHSMDDSIDEPHNHFRMMDDNDFRMEDNHYSEPVMEPKIVKVIEKDLPLRSKDTDDYSNLYQGKNKPVEKQPYGYEESPKVSVHDYGIYEKKEERSYFKPSPIISPIYGILDKNYRKEEVVTKREVRLTSSYARENLSVDDVRKKAFGSLSDDIALVGVKEEVRQETQPTFDVEEDTNLLVDLSADDEKPAVKGVTMGDALEYFQDLGLEYNVDYVDSTKGKATGRREKDIYEEEKSLLTKVEDKKVPVQRLAEETPKASVDIESDDNLFDLIDSMYQEND